MSTTAKTITQSGARTVARTYWVASALIGGALILSGVIGADVVQFVPMSITQFSTALLPLVFVSAILERLVEVFLTPWRNGGRIMLETDVRANEAAADPAALKSSQQALIAFKADSQKLAFLAATVCGLLAAAVGFRALEGLADPAAIATYSRLQLAAFRAFDVVVTAGLLAGGADVVHKFISAITDFMEAGSRAARKNAQT